MKKGICIACCIAGLFAVAWTAQSVAMRIVIIGDSTVMTYTASDSLRGWGQELALFFNVGAVTVVNKAIGGRSSRSFIEDGHWASTLGILQKGDFLFIQFGHNDRSTVAERHADTAQYRQYLTQYVTESRAKGAIPILVSPMNMNAWNGTTLREVFNEGANDYHAAMLRVANTQKVPFIDLEQKTAKIFQSLGQVYLTAFIFNTGEGTHFQEMGALLNARCVAEGIKELSADADVGKLSAVLGPQYMVTVKSNKSGAGMITASGTYPPGAPLVIKTVPNSGEVFQSWQNTSGASITTQTMFKDTMENSAITFTALFKGGTATLSQHRKSMRPESIYLKDGINGQYEIVSRGPISSLRAIDARGRTTNLQLTEGYQARFGSPSVSAMTMLEIKTRKGSFILPMVRFK